MKWIGEHIQNYRTRLREDTHFDKLVDPGSDTDKFLVVDGGKIGYRTGAEVLSDIGGGPGDMTGVDLTAGTGIDISSETNTTSGDYSATLAVDVSDFMTNGTDNRIVTATGTDGMNAEGNLTFDGSTLAVAGKQTITNPYDGGTSALEITNADMDENSLKINDTGASGSTSDYAAVFIDANHSHAGVAGSYSAIQVDLDCNVDDTYNRSLYGLEVDMDYTVGNGGTQRMYGIWLTPTLSLDTDSGTADTYGAYIAAAGGSNGTSATYGVYVYAHSADTNYGIYNIAIGTTYDFYSRWGLRNQGGAFATKTTAYGATTISTLDDESNSEKADLTFDVEGTMHNGTAYHVISRDVSVTAADSSDNTVGVQVLDVKIPQYAIITKVAAVIKEATNLGTHKVMLTLSTDNSLAADAEVTNNTELLGAGVTDTDSTDSTSASDIDMTATKKVWIRQGLQAGNRVTVSADSYLYIANAADNGTTNPSSGILSIYIEYYGMD